MTQTRARRIPQTVAVRFARTSGTCHTLEGQVAYEAGDAIATGAAREQWPIPRADFSQLYEAIAPAEMFQDGTYRRRSEIVTVRQLQSPITVALPNERGTLSGQPGDWLVILGPENYSIVAKDLFCRLYELLEEKPD